MNDNKFFKCKEAGDLKMISGIRKELLNNFAIHRQGFLYQAMDQK